MLNRHSFSVIGKKRCEKSFPGVCLPWFGGRVNVVNAFFVARPAYILHRVGQNDPSDVFLSFGLRSSIANDSSVGVVIFVTFLRCERLHIRAVFVICALFARFSAGNPILIKQSRSKTKVIGSMRVVTGIVFI